MGPPGTAFNPAIGVCDWPENVPGCGAQDVPPKNPSPPSNNDDYDGLRDCYDIKHFYPNSKSGVYTVYPRMSDACGKPIQVYCDMETEGGGWTVFQSRKDGSVSFDQNFKKYTEGFGDVKGEFWLGLETIHQMTSCRKHELRIDLSDFEKKEVFAKYQDFSVTEGNGYKIKYDVKSYSGNAGDCFGIDDPENNKKFSTSDKDRDTSDKENCAKKYNGSGWWHQHCGQCSLNGAYLKGKVSSEQERAGINWRTFRGDAYSLKSSQMKFRPVY